jgi:hypothetical protein
MDPETSRKTVGTSPVALYTHPTAKSDGAYGPRTVTLINVSATPATIVLGGADVTATTGARWIVEAGRTFDWKLVPGGAIYGIVTSGSQDIDVLAGVA